MCHSRLSFPDSRRSHQPICRDEFVGEVQPYRSSLEIVVGFQYVPTRSPIISLKIWLADWFLACKHSNILNRRQTRTPSFIFILFIPILIRCGRILCRYFEFPPMTVPKMRRSSTRSSLGPSFDRIWKWNPHAGEGHRPGYSRHQRSFLKCQPREPRTPWWEGGLRSRLCLWIS